MPTLRVCLCECHRRICNDQSSRPEWRGWRGSRGGVSRGANIFFPLLGAGVFASGGWQTRQTRQPGVAVWMAVWRDAFAEVSAYVTQLMLYVSIRSRGIEALHDAGCIGLKVIRNGRA